MISLKKIELQIGIVETPEQKFEAAGDKFRTKTRKRQPNKPLECFIMKFSIINYDSMNVSRYTVFGKVIKCIIYFIN